MLLIGLHLSVFRSTSLTLTEVDSELCSPNGMSVVPVVLSAILICLFADRVGIRASGRGGPP